MATYEFTIKLRGEGTSEEDAWDNAVEAFIEEPGDFDSAKLLEADRPKVQLSENDGNVYGIIGKCKDALSRAGLKEKAAEFRQKALSAKSYDEVLTLAMEYCEVE